MKKTFVGYVDGKESIAMTLYRGGHYGTYKNRYSFKKQLGMEDKNGAKEYFVRPIKRTITIEWQDEEVR